MTYTGGKVNIRFSWFGVTLHPDSVQNYIENMNDGGNTQLICDTIFLTDFKSLLHVPSGDNGRNPLCVTFYLNGILGRLQ